MNKQKILEAYSDGSPIALIVESFNTTYEQVIEVLNTYKEDSRYKRTFTEEFRRMIAERDMNGVTRSSIAKELKLNVNTVKKACEAYGQTLKEKATSDKALTKIDGEFKLDTCPSCGSKKNNLVDENITFCMSCDSEHEYFFEKVDKDGKVTEKPYVMKVNFEYIEE